MKLFLYLFNILSIFNFGSNFTQKEIYAYNQEALDVISISDKAYVIIGEYDSYLYYENVEYILDDYVINKTLDTLNNIYLVCNNEDSIMVIVFNKFNNILSYVYNKIKG